MEVKQYDYIVIGGGSGGIASANELLHGAKVILLKQNSWWHLRESRMCP